MTLRRVAYCALAWSWRCTLVIGVVVLRGVVGPAKRWYRLLEPGLRAVARATQGVDGAGDVGRLGSDVGAVARSQGLAGGGGGASDVWDTHSGVLRGHGGGIVLLVVVLVGLLCRVVGPATKGWKRRTCLVLHVLLQRGGLVDDEGGLGVGLDLVALRQGLGSRGARRL